MISDTLDLDARLEAAIGIAREAGALALDYFRNRDRLSVETKRHPTDLVSEADREVEVLIRSALSAAFPDDAQLGEEHGISAGSSGLTWVIDPIDGTAPYLKGMPGWCVSIGAHDGEKPVIGVIYAPVLDEMFSARHGQGVTLNGAEIRVTTDTVRTGLLGFGANDRVDPAQVGNLLADLMQEGSSWTRYGSGALMLAWVAAGRLVGYVEPRMSAWDCLAGYCLIEEAGGRVLPFPTGTAITQPAPVLGACLNAYDDLMRITRFAEPVPWEAPAR